MSVFDSVMEEHNQKKHEAAEALKVKEAREKFRTETFKADVLETYRSIVMPIFDTYVKNIQEYSFAARTELHDDDNGILAVSLSMIPEPNVGFGNKRSNESYFAIKAYLVGQTTEFQHLYDQRPGKNGADHRRFDLASLNKELLEKELSLFFKAAITARDPV